MKPWCWVRWTPASTAIPSSRIKDDVVVEIVLSAGCGDLIYLTIAYIPEITSISGAAVLVERRLKII